MRVDETQLIAQIAENLQQRLGQRWTVEQCALDTKFVDACLTLSNQVNKQFTFGIEFKPTVRPADVPGLKERFRAIQQENPEINLVLGARYLAPSTRAALEEANISYIDAAGNARIEISNPVFLFINQGLNKDPWRTPGRPTATLKGEPAAKVVRTLLDFTGPWKVRKLIETSKTSPGSVYRVLQFLEAEALVVSTLKGYQVSNLETLINRWAQDYTFSGANTVTGWLAPRGVEFALNQLRQSPDVNYVATGSVAASTWSEYAPTKIVALYSNEPKELAERLDLRETDYGANVRIAIPVFDVLSERASVREDGLRVAAPSQVAVDLLNGPGREPAEGANLIDWMVKHESAWRR